MGLQRLDTMVFQCNIDDRGKAYRLKIGIWSLLAGLVLAVVFYLADVDWWMLWLAPAGMIGGGAFAIFEAKAGWCVVRAMGFKTPI